MASTEATHRPWFVHGETDWQERGDCRGVNPDLFFPERGAPSGPGKDVCDKCPVQQECLSYALFNGEKFGIWGGLSERERQRIRRQRSLVLTRARLAMTPAAVETALTFYEEVAV